jgi:hypothetical protein
MKGGAATTCRSREAGIGGEGAAMGHVWRGAFAAGDLKPEGVVTRRCFTMWQDVNRRCFAMQQDVNRRCYTMQHGQSRNRFHHPGQSTATLMRWAKRVLPFWTLTQMRTVGSSNWGTLTAM